MKKNKNSYKLTITVYRALKAGMTKREFYLIAIIVIFCYLAIIFQVNLKNALAIESGEFSGFTFNAF